MAKKNKEVNSIEAQAANQVAWDQIKGFARKGASTGNLSCIPTGHFILDFALNYGCYPNESDINSEEYNTKSLGVPFGKVVEISGDEGSGKSSICYRLVANVQKMGYPALWFDVEQSFSEDLAKINGVNLDELAISEYPGYAENIFNNLFKAVEAGFKIIVIDSVAAMVPEEQGEAAAEDQKMALLARVISRNLPKLLEPSAKNDCTVVFINQLRQKPGVSFGDNSVTPGGNALKFYSSIRLKLNNRYSGKHAIFIEDTTAIDNKRYIGKYNGLTISKNRFGKPFVNSNGSREVIDIPIYFEPYFPNIEEIAFDAGRQSKLIAIRKGEYTWNEYKKMSKIELLNILEKDKDVLNKLIEELKAEAETNGTLLPPEIIIFNPKDKRVKRVESGDNTDGFSGNNSFESIKVVNKDETEI